MSRLENIEDQVKQLSSEELSAFREWFAEFDAAIWDRQFETDVKAGKLDNFAERVARPRRWAVYGTLIYRFTAKTLRKAQRRKPEQRLRSDGRLSSARRAEEAEPRNFPQRMTTSLEVHALYARSFSGLERRSEATTEGPLR